jgi:hypothetical protein
MPSSKKLDAWCIILPKHNDNFQVRKTKNTSITYQRNIPKNHRLMQTKNTPFLFSHITRDCFRLDQIFTRTCSNHSFFSSHSLPAFARTKKNHNIPCLPIKSRSRGCVGSSGRQTKHKTRVETQSDTK